MHSIRGTLVITNELAHQFAFPAATCCKFKFVIRFWKGKIILPYDKV